MTNNDFLNTIQSLKNITEAGFSNSKSVEELTDNKLSLEKKFDEFRLCCEWIKKFTVLPSAKQLKRINTAQSYRSYYLKHLVEKWCGKYIPNGAFIVAVSYLKIPYRRIYGTPDILVVLFLKENNRTH